MGKQSLKISKASQQEIQSVIDFLNQLEDLIEDQEDEKLGYFARKKYPNHSIRKIITGYGVLLDSACDPDSNVLEFNNTIKENSKWVDFATEFKINFNVVIKKYDIKKFRILVGEFCLGKDNKLHYNPLTKERFLKDEAIQNINFESKEEAFDFYKAHQAKYDSGINSK